MKKIIKPLLLSLCMAFSTGAFAGDNEVATSEMNASLKKLLKAVASDSVGAIDDETKDFLIENLPILLGDKEVDGASASFYDTKSRYDSGIVTYIFDFTVTEPPTGDENEERDFARRVIFSLSVKTGAVSEVSSFVSAG